MSLHFAWQCCSPPHSKLVWTTLDKHRNSCWSFHAGDNIQENCLKFTIHNTYCQTTAWHHPVEMGSLSTALCLLGSRGPCAVDGHHSASNGCPWRSRSSHCAAKQIQHPLPPQAVRSPWPLVGSPLQHYYPWTTNNSHLEKWERLTVRWGICRLHYQQTRLENTDLLWNTFKCSKYTTCVLFTSMLLSSNWIWGTTRFISLKDTVCFKVQLLIKMTFT